MAKDNKSMLGNMNGLSDKPKGDSGSNQLFFTDEYSNEFLPAMQGSQGSINFMKMAKSDPQIGMMLTIYKNPIKSTNWGFPKEDDLTPQENEAIDLLNSYYFDNKYQNFSDLLCQILSFIEYGFSCFEIYWQPYMFNGKPYLMPVLEQRIQTSIEKIYYKEGYVQQSTYKNGLVDIPLEDMIFFSLDRQGNDLRGQSILRNSFPSWIDKNRFRVFQGIGIQRSQTGIPWMEVPEGTSADDPEYISARNLLENITCHENAFMITLKNYTFDIKSFKNEPEKLQNIIDKLDEKMAISVLAQFILLGTGGGGGAYALSRDQSDMFLDGLAYIVSYIERIFHCEILKKIVEYNFVDNIDIDKIWLRGLNLNKKAGAELADTIQKLSASGFLKATLDDEVQLRQYLELPTLSEKEIEQRDNQPILNNPKVEHVKLAEQSKSKREQMLDLETKQLKDVMQANLILIKDKLVHDIETVMNRGSVEINGLKAIEVSYSKYAKNLERKLAGIANEGWSIAKKNAKSNNIKLSEPMDASKLDNKTLLAYVKNEAELIAEDQVTTMKIRSIATASSSNLKGYSNSQTIANVESVIDEFLAGQKVSTGASLMVVGGLNFGEQQFYKEISDQLWGYKFIAVDDGNTSEICQWYKEKTFSINSVEMSIANPPLHPNALIKGSRIVTDKGIMDIEKIKVGDRVLTHKNRFKEVYAVMNRFEDKHYYEIELNNGKKINITAEHPILVGRNKQLIWVRVDELNLSDNIVCIEDLVNVRFISE